MTNAPPTRSSGFSLIELVVVLVIVAIISAVLLDRVKFYQEQAEKTTMETTAAAIQAALLMRMAGYLATGHESDVQKLASENPMDWLARKPDSYAGRLDGRAARDLPGGSWYFDIGDRSVVYLVRYGRAFVPDAEGRKEVRFRARVEYGRLEEGSSLSGIKSLEFGPVHPYVWRIE